MTTRKQIVRFGVVGVVSNLVLYLLYLALTEIGVGHKAAMTALYIVGVTQTFLVNRAWTFGHQGSAGPAMARYVAVYVGGYAFQWLTLYALVDVAGLPHRLVMAGLIVVMAGLLFLAQKFWVFSAKRAVPGSALN